MTRNINIRKDEVQLLLRLEAELERHDERAVHTRENETLSKRMRNLVPINDVRLADRLQGIDTLCITLADLHDLAEAALANDCREFEIIDSQRVALDR